MKAEWILVIFGVAFIFLYGAIHLNMAPMAYIGILLIIINIFFNMPIKELLKKAS